MPLLLIRCPDKTLQRHEFAAELTVGRANVCDVVLLEGGVSRRHARFFLDGETVFVEDLGSANGTFVDDEPIEEPTPLTPTSQIVVGDYSLSVEPASTRRRSVTRSAPAAADAPPARRRPEASRPGAPSAAPRPRALPARAASGHGEARLARRSEEPPEAGPVLRGLTGPWANQVFPLEGTVVVGRVAGVQIQLEDESVSRRHAELECTPEGVRLRDLESANGTTVNGTRISEECLLQPGDIVSFGMIELALEDPNSASALAVPLRGSAGAPRRRGDDGGGRKLLLGVAAAVVAIVLTAGVVVKFGGLEGPVVAQNPSPNPAGGPADTSAQVDRLLAECRSYAATDVSTAPNWKKAMAACEKARDLDPINTHVIAQIRKITLELECEQNFEEGKKAMNLLREEAALEAFGRIDRKCSYYRTVKPRAREAILAVKKKAKDDCNQYARNNFWEQALPRCEKYMTFVCQNMSAEALHPPPGYEVDLWGRRPKRNAWRPKDPVYLNLLRAREKRDPNLGPWMCPPTPLFEDDIAVSDPRVAVEKLLANRFKEPLMEQAMMLYWSGQSAEAVVKLQRLRENRSKAESHRAADDMRLDISAVENLYKTGSTLLQASDFDRASEAFNEALRLDEKLLGATLGDQEGFYRRTIKTDMARAAYEGGKHWMDRKDERRGCKLWKLGFSFTRESTDLNRALQFCADLARKRLPEAKDCARLDALLEFTTEKDGVHEKVVAERARLTCGS